MTAPDRVGSTLRMPVVVSPQVVRESACPVHFLWDSVGVGRWGVRLGFLGFLVAGMMITGASMMRVDALRTASVMVVTTSAALWLVGHALTRWGRWRAR